LQNLRFWSREIVAKNWEMDAAEAALQNVRIINTYTYDVCVKRELKIPLSTMDLWNYF
jgi:hypothetical protein